MRDIKELEKIIIEASQAYYGQGNSPISDFEFDSLVDELKQRDPKNILLSTTGYGYKPKHGEKVKHLYHQIKGIDFKTKDIDDIPKEEYIITPKYDGGSAVVYYKDGVKQFVLSRGNGEYGVNVTSNVNAPDKLDTPFTGYIRGELVVSWEDFKKYFENASHPRNTAVGLSKLLDNKDSRLKYLKMVVYILWDDEKKLFYPIGTENFKHITKDKFHTSPFHIKQELKEEELDSMFPNEFAFDGYVFYPTINFHPDRIKVLKTLTDSAWSSVKMIHWNTSATKKIFPTLEIETVNVSGANIKYVTGNSFKWMKDNNIRIGTKVRISRSNEVIPKVIEIERNEITIQNPTCSEGCAQKPKEKGANVYCSNPECPSTKENIYHRLVFSFAEKGFTDRMYRIMKGAEIGEMTDREVQMIEKCKQEMAKGKIDVFKLFFVAICEGLGAVGIKEILEHYKDRDSLTKAILNESIDQEVKFSNKKFKEAIGQSKKDLKHILEKFQIEPFHLDNKKSKGDVYISGKGINKKEFKKEIERRGYTFKKLSKNSKYLISNIGNESNSVKKAKEWGIEIKTPEEFLNEKH